MSNGQRDAANNDAVNFEYGDLSFSIPTSENWPIDVLENVEDGKLTGALKALLGDDQWDKFKEKYNTVGHLNKLFDAAGEAVNAKN